MEKNLVLEMDTAIDFDSIIENDTTMDFLRYLKENNIRFKIIEWIGPGGGWPLIHYIATKAILEKMLMERFLTNAEDLAFEMESATEEQI